MYPIKSLYIPNVSTLFFCSTTICAGIPELSLVGEHRQDEVNGCEGFKSTLFLCEVKGEALLSCLESHWSHYAAYIRVLLGKHCIFRVWPKCLQVKSKASKISGATDSETGHLLAYLFSWNSNSPVRFEWPRPQGAICFVFFINRMIK
jgi:hypothetical protein